MKMKPPSMLLALLLTGFLVAGVSIATNMKSPAEGTPDPMVIIGGNSIRGFANLFYERPLTYATLIACLAFQESSNNPDAVGKAGECGILQFMPSTFKMYCVDRYGVAGSMEQIWDVEIQRRCADEMISENWGNVRHWTTAPLCIY